VNLGGALNAQKKPDEAIACFRKAIELDPKLANAYSNLGAVLAQQGKPDEAIACYRKATEVDPKHVNAYSNLGSALANQGKLDDAVAALRKALELDPTHAKANSNLGDVLNYLAWPLATDPVPARRDPGRAVSLAKEAVERKPGMGACWNTLGIAQYRAGGWKEAVAALEKSMKLGNGGDSFDWFFLAMSHWRLGEKDKAREWYDRAVQWMDKNQPKDEELRRFRAEASELLELKGKK
jgi:superkiller protein 3